MLSVKLAWRNLVGAGMRSWLNVFILSIVIVTIIAFQGLFNGWQREGELGRIRWHIADGQLWQENYDPYDPFSYSESRIELPAEIDDASTVEFLVSEGVVYPQGRRQTVVINGVEAEQEILELPTEKLKYEPDSYKMMLGFRMADKLEVKKGDHLMLRWRDANGSFDAREFEIVHIFTTAIMTIDLGYVWLGLEQLQKMLNEEGRVTYISYSGEQPQLEEGWLSKTQQDLLAKFRNLLSAKRAGGSFMYILLMFLAMIAVFDTQVLAMFRRRREIGMMMALGMPRKQLVQTFTMEGFISGLLSVLLAAVWGAPLLVLFAQKGIAMPEMMSGYGIDGFVDAMYPQFNAMLIISSVFLVLVILLIVSYLPVGRIAKENPVDILYGRSDGLRPNVKCKM